MAYRLQHLTREQLVELAATRTPFELAAREEAGGLPPAEVAARSLSQLAAGGSERWCGTYVIVDAADGRIVGGCRFKGEPLHGRVEVSYGVAASRRRQGVARWAVRQLVAIAFDQGAEEVLAEIALDNVASARTAQSSGFQRMATRIDDDGEEVACWVVRRRGLRETLDS